MTSSVEWLTLVDAHDRPVGVAEKLSVHRDGRLHRAFSVVVVDAQGRWLLQRRAADKYHAGGLWSNTCCGHPRPHEATPVAARRRLGEEMGLTLVLVPAFRFRYRARLNNGLVEHEWDHVFVAFADDAPRPDPREVSDWCWVDPSALDRAVRSDGAAFTPWFRILLAPLRAWLAARRPS